MKSGQKKFEPQKCSRKKNYPTLFWSKNFEYDSSVVNNPIIASHCVFVVQCF